MVGSNERALSRRAGPHKAWEDRRPLNRFLGVTLLLRTNLFLFAVEHNREIKRADPKTGPMGIQGTGGPSS